MNIVRNVVAGQWSEAQWKSHVRCHRCLDQFVANNPALDLDAHLAGDPVSRIQRLIEIAVGLHLTAGGFQAPQRQLHLRIPNVVDAGHQAVKLPERAVKEVDYEIDGGVFYVEVTHLSPHSEEGATDRVFDELESLVNPVAEERRFCVSMDPQCDLETLDVRQVNTGETAEQIVILVRNMPPEGGMGWIDGFGIPPVRLEIETHPVPVIGHAVIPIRPFGPAFGLRDGAPAPNRRLNSRLMSKKAQLRSRSPVVLAVFAEGSYTDRMETDIIADCLEKAVPGAPCWPEFVSFRQA